MTAETDAEFLDRLQPSWPGTNDSVRLPMSDFDRLFALARRGAALQLVEQKLTLKDGKPCVEETYFRRMFLPLPPPPAGETEHE